MPIRNPFARRPGVILVQDERGDPLTPADDVPSPGFERVDTVGSRASSVLSIRSKKSQQDTGEYKMSVVNDSGVYLPPSPVEHEAVWPRRYLSRTSSDKSSIASGEIEHFSISRESFDSYRRSFDICAKSPIVMPADSNYPPRASLDSRLPGGISRAVPRSERRFLVERERAPPTPEEESSFEDVVLGDESARSQQQQQQQQQHEEHEEQQQAQQPAAKKKGGFFSKFGSESGAAADVPVVGGGVSVMGMPRLWMGGRKRAPSQSGLLGAELAAMPVVSVGAGLPEPGAVPIPALKVEG